VITGDAPIRMARPGPDLRHLVNSTAVVAGLTVVALVAASALLRSSALAGPFWIDEGLSVGIASHPVAQIPDVLRQDGSPPLYYLILHLWTGAFGSGVAVTHLLSLVFALLCIPAGLWAGWSLFGRRAGIVCAVLFAVNPMLSAYGQETRMYSLLALLGLVTVASFLHAFVYRRRAYVPVFGLGLALMLYTHNWSAFFAAGTAVGLAVVLAGQRPSRNVLAGAALALAAVAAIYLPWLPTVLFQASHTGAPWAAHPGVASLTHAPYVLFGGADVGMAVLLAGGAGIIAIAGARAGSPERVAAIALLVIAAATLLTAFIYSQFTLAWAWRYLTVLLGPVLLLAALGLSRARRLGIAGVALAVVLSIGGTSSAVPHNKSNLNRVADRFEQRLGRGDVIVSTQPEQTAALRYYFGKKPRYATPFGRTPDPRVMDWRNALARLQSAPPSQGRLGPLLARLKPGRRLLVVTPVTNAAGWRAPWTRLVRTRSRQWSRAIAHDATFRPVAALHPSSRSRLSTVRAKLYVKRRD
jgi:mannosyltransferase